MGNKTKLGIIAILISSVLAYAYWDENLPKVTVEPQKETNYYGYHGKVLVVNNVEIDHRRKGKSTTKYVLLKVNEDKIYGRFEATGLETRTNEPNSRYFIQITTQELNGKMVAAQATLLIYLDKEDWELFKR